MDSAGVLAGRRMIADWNARPAAYSAGGVFLALDRASVRSTDIDGHLHIARANISKAAVNGYLGSEIPGAAEMGLSSGRVYQLLRDPQELAKAAPTFNGKPLLSTHKPQSAADHDHDLTVGSVANVEWHAPYLTAELVVWDAVAIAGIETGEQRELSCGYRYIADMTPGTYQGVAYDGVMRDIIGNHVALVETGRAGSDVVVGDAALKGNEKMDDDAINVLLEFLADKLEADDLESVRLLLTDGAPGADDPDLPRPLPRPGGALAADRAMRRRFPGVAALKLR